MTSQVAPKRGGGRHRGDPAGLAEMQAFPSGGPSVDGQPGNKRHPCLDHAAPSEPKWVPVLGALGLPSSCTLGPLSGWGQVREAQGYHHNCFSCAAAARSGAISPGPSKVRHQATSLTPSSYPQAIRPGSAVHGYTSPPLQLLAETVSVLLCPTNISLPLLMAVILL